MSKLQKTVGKFKLWAFLGAVVVIAGIVICAIFGFNADYTASDSKSLTVKMNSFVYDMKADDVKKICEAELDKAGLKDVYSFDGEMSGDSDEIVYVFSASVSDEKLAAMKASLETALNTAVEDPDNSLYGAFQYVTVTSEQVAATLPAGYIWRGILAAAVVLVIEFVYVSARYKLNMGITTAATSLLGLLLTGAIVAIVRIPVTTSLAYVLAFGMLYPALLAMLIFNKMRENFKTDEYKAMPADEAIASSVPAKTILVFAGASAAALVILGVIAVASVRWFALAALAAVAAGTFSALVFMPAMYLPLKKISDKKAAERARYDYKKGDKAQKGKASEDEAKAEPAKAE